MKKRFHFATALLISVIAGQTLADASPIRHGLWEYKFSMRMQNAEIEKQIQEAQKLFATMPPEQRKMMEQTMASYGMAFGSDMQTLKICISEEKASLGIIPQQDGNCTYKVIERKDNHLKMTFTCDGDSPVSGESEITFNSPTSYTGKSVINTMVQGQSERMTVEQNGKWLSYDCGNIKPR